MQTFHTSRVHLERKAFECEGQAGDHRRCNNGRLAWEANGIGLGRPGMSRAYTPYYETRIVVVCGYSRLARLSHGIYLNAIKDIGYTVIGMHIVAGAHELL